jgi:hypothetical protein
MRSLRALPVSLGRDASVQQDAGFLRWSEAPLSGKRLLACIPVPLPGKPQWCTSGQYPEGRRRRRPASASEVVRSQTTNSSSSGKAETYPPSGRPIANEAAQELGTSDRVSLSGGRPCANSRRRGTVNALNLAVARVHYRRQMRAFVERPCLQDGRCTPTRSGCRSRLTWPMSAGAAEARPRASARCPSTFPLADRGEDGWIE